MGLTSRTVLVLTVVLTLLAPVTLALVWRAGPRGRVVGALARFGAVAMCQLVAMAALFCYVNDQYAFYSSWSDLLGRATPAPGLRTAGLVAAGQGSVRVLSVHSGRVNGGAHQMLAWLPPGYDSPSQARRRYPVLMFLPGQPSNPVTTFGHFHFAAVATQEIRTGRIAPFVAVFPPLMVDPPRDTECTNVPGGPQAESWLDRDVWRAVNQDLRTDRRPWTVMGWSTGAFCAAKLLLGQPRLYAAAVGLGGYYTPVSDRTTGDLFGRRSRVRDENSPTWLYAHDGGLSGRRLLVVAGRQDTESYPMTRAFLTAVGPDPDVSSLEFPSGRHNYRNYTAMLPRCLDWLQARRTAPA